MAFVNQDIFETNGPAKEFNQIMKRMLRVPLTCLTLIAFAAVSVRAGTPTAEKILPDDTLAMITVPDCAKLRAVSAKSPMGRLWDDPAMKPFRGLLKMKSWSG